MRAMGLGLFLVLAGFGVALALLSSPPFRELDPVSAHLRAVGVAELGYANVVARLAATPWHRRWFAAGPALSAEEPAGGGSFAHAIRDVLARPDQAGARRADLLVRGRFEGNEAVLHWRLELPRDSLAEAVLPVPVHFSFAPQGSGLAAADLDRAAARADSDAQLRAASTARFESQRARLLALPAGAGPAPVLEVAP